MELLNGIRAATHETHERLHQHPVMSPLVSSKLELNHYGFAISAFERFYTALATQTPDAYINHLSLSALKKDLIALSIDTSSLEPCSLPMIVCDADSMLGMLYVIEGSRMGGQVIAKNVRQTLHLDESSGLAFFSGNGKDTAGQWKDFVHKLQSECFDTDTCIKAAEQTFLLLERWLWTVWNEDKSKTLITNKGELA